MEFNCRGISRFNQRLLAVIGVVLIFAVNVSAQQQTEPNLNPVKDFEKGELRIKDLSSLRRIMVVEEGRILPLDSYARITLLRFSGRYSFKRRPAIEWLARVMFTPNETHEDEIFLVDNPEVLDAIGLDSHGRDRYSLKFLLPGLPELEILSEDATTISEKNRTSVEHEILRLWNNVGSYANLLSTLAFTYPHSDFQIEDQSVISTLGLLGPGAYSYLDIALRRNELRESLNSARVAHASSGQFSMADRVLLRLGQSIAGWRANFAGLSLPIIPIQNPQGIEWLSPWQALDDQYTKGQNSKQLRALEIELLALRDLQVAYLEGRQIHFGIAARQFIDSIQRRAEVELALKDPDIEIFYNLTNPYRWAKLSYGIGLLSFALSFLFFRQFLQTISFFFLLVGIAPHTMGLLLRILITDRPPVTNLFETFIFVGWGAVLLGIVMERLKKHPLGLFCGLTGGFVFLLLSAKFSPEGDTMPVLQAVLDTNFWLSTHVIVVTSGYMTCCVAGLIGHVYMVQSVVLGRRVQRKQTSNINLTDTYRALFGTLALGLTFSFVGTMLGGIWADQSWGRFWGWDPKENGALLIVLWCAILFHAKMGKMIGPFGMAAGSALLIIVVMLAWFGINLLGVGLHSYGFIDGVFLGLMIYSIVQIALVAIITSLHYQQKRQLASLQEDPSETSSVV